MPNRLAQESSPYLLQHADDPVDWYPWGAEAFELARREGKPIFLSIGYAACHWCHVMARESFRDPEVARRLNEGFVPVKVDREERPDVDQIYMEAVQLMTQRGGWPLSVFLTPSLEPFFGGTYWPPEPRMGMPSFIEVLDAVAAVWRERREEAEGQAARVTRLLREDLLGRVGQAGGEALGAHLLEASGEAMARAFDSQYGGFGAAPKFPHATDLQVLLRLWRRTGRADYLHMVTHTLNRMAAGGIYDHLGGGFHRYSTDERWVVPHFEKMLYDSALLANTYLEAWQATGDPDYARVVRETLDYVLRRLTAPEGGFYSAEDADSEGQEGKYYLWTAREIGEVLGERRGSTFCYVYGVTDAGNYEGRNVLHMPKTIDQCARILGRSAEELRAELAESRCRLLARRQQRVRPAVDDKVLASWNGLMIDAMARAGAAFAEARYREAAARAGRFVMRNLRTSEGGLRHCWRRGAARYGGYLEDYASMAGALVTLYEAEFDERWIDEAIRLADMLLDRFRDRVGGGFFFATADTSLIARKKDMLDSSVPSGGGLAVRSLLRLGQITGQSRYLNEAEAVLRDSEPIFQHALAGAGQLLLALDHWLGPAFEIVLLGSSDADDTAAVFGQLYRKFVPNKVVAFRQPGQVDRYRCSALETLFAGKEPVAPGPTLYICQHGQCQVPACGHQAAAEALAGLAEVPVAPA